MADIRKYMRERKERERRHFSFKQKIRIHKLKALYRILLAAAALAALAALMVVQYKRRIYTGYDVVSSLERETAQAATDIRLLDCVLTYSRDGAHCTDAKGNVTWNETYQIQDVKIAVNRDVAAIGSYNGREIYVSNTKGRLGTIATAMPIRDITVSATGYVTAVLADTNATWVNTYSPSGELAYYGETYMGNSGYPAAVSLSPNGELLAVSYVYMDAGVLKTNVVFYNFGPVGANQSDYLVSAYTYTDELMPKIQFMDNGTAYAVGDGSLRIYKGEQKPMETTAHFYDSEVRAVFSGEKYIGLVFAASEGEYRYQLNVYDASGQKVGSYPFQMEYTDIFFGPDHFVIYNETECLIMTFGGVEKYRGRFSRTVNAMIPLGTSYKYLLAADGSLDTIQLK